MTTIPAHDWSRLLALLGLPASTEPAAVLAAVERRLRGERFRAQTERDIRATAIRNCRRCDQWGWQLAGDGTPVDPARKCDHAVLPPSRSFAEPLHDRTDTEEDR